MSQQRLLTQLEEHLDLTPAELAGVLGVSYSTYMKWRLGSRTMPAVGLRCVALVQQLYRLGQLDDVLDALYDEGE